MAKKSNFKNLLEMWRTDGGGIFDKKSSFSGDRSLAKISQILYTEKKNEHMLYMMHMEICHICKAGDIK